MKLLFGELKRSLLSEEMSGIVFEWVILRLDSEGNFKVCELVNGLLCGMVICFLGDQVIVRNAGWTNW